MKRIITLLAAMIGFAGSTYAQPSFTLLDTVQTFYERIQEVNNTVFAGMRSNNRIDLRTHAGNSFGQVTGSVTAGGASSYFSHMEAVGNYLYLGGSTLQGINVTNPSAPSRGLEQPVRFVKELSHWSNLLYVIHDDGIDDKVFIHSLANAMQPALVDSFSLPHSGVFKVGQNSGYCIQHDTLAGTRIFTYTLANTAPYFTATDTLRLVPGARLDFPMLDIVGDHLFAKTMDSVYHFHLMPNGSLHRLSVLRSSVWPQHFVAKDTAVLFYATAHQVIAGAVRNGATTTIDTISAMSFNSFRNIGRLGSNIYYFDYMGGKLIGPSATGIPGISYRNDDRFSCYPNPATTSWTADSKTDGMLQLYSADGRLMRVIQLKADSKAHISLAELSAGSYYYSITAKDGLRSGGLLVKQ